LTKRRGRRLTSQAIGTLLRNRLYAGIVDIPEYGVRAKRGDFEPLISGNDASQMSNRTQISDTVQTPGRVARRRI
jgi:hypothetical protein